MATRSIMGIKTASGVITQAIYVHWDGHPNTRMPILEGFYNTEKKVRELFSLGDISALYPNIKAPEGVEHTFDNPCKGVTVAYARDRGEDKIKMLHNSRVSELNFIQLGHDYNAEYVYVFDVKSSTWSWTEIY